MNKDILKQELQRWANEMPFSLEIHEENDIIYINENLIWNETVTYRFVCALDYDENEEIDLNDNWDFWIGFELDGYNESLDLYRVINELNSIGDDYNIYNVSYDDDGTVSFLYKEYVESLSDTLDHAINSFSNRLYDSEHYSDDDLSDYNKKIGEVFNKLLKLRTIEE